VTASCRWRIFHWRSYLPSCLPFHYSAGVGVSLDALFFDCHIWTLDTVDEERINASGLPRMMQTVWAKRIINGVKPHSWLESFKVNQLIRWQNISIQLGTWHEGI
jgi:hypothetical protein